MADIGRVGVVGGGLMGAGIAEVMIRRGLPTVLVEVDQAAAQSAAQKVAESMRRAATRGKLEDSDVHVALRLLTTSTQLRDLADCDLVVEATPEVEPLKVGLFDQLGKVVLREDAILASNTSSIPIVKLGAVSGRPHQVIGIHFFNPAPVMRLVELIPSLTTSADTLARAEQFVHGVLGKHAVRATDRAGFVVNSLLIPYLFSAIRMLEAGYASAQDIDASMVLGCGHPMGPLALSDLIGLDTIRAIGESMYKEWREPLYAPPPLLERMVEANLLGKKTGRGFHAADVQE